MKNKKVCFYSLVVVLFIAGSSLYGSEGGTLKGISLEEVDNNQLNDEEKESINFIANELFDGFVEDLGSGLKQVLKQLAARMQKNFEAKLIESAISIKREEEEGEEEKLYQEITEL